MGHSVRRSSRSRRARSSSWPAAMTKPTLFTVACDSMSGSGCSCSSMLRSREVPTAKVRRSGVADREPQDASTSSWLLASRAIALAPTRQLACWRMETSPVATSSGRLECMRRELISCKVLLDWLGASFSETAADTNLATREPANSRSASLFDTAWQMRTARSKCDRAAPKRPATTRLDARVCSYRMARSGVARRGRETGGPSTSSPASVRALRSRSLAESSSIVSPLRCARAVASAK